MNFRSIVGFIRNVAKATRSSEGAFCDEMFTAFSPTPNCPLESIVVSLHNDANLSWGERVVLSAGAPINPRLHLLFREEGKGDRILNTRIIPFVPYLAYLIGNYDRVGLLSEDCINFSESKCLIAIDIAFKFCFGGSIIFPREPFLLEVMRINGAFYPPDATNARYSVS